MSDPKFAFDFPSRAEEEEGTPLTLWFEEFNGGVLVKGRNEETGVETNILFLSKRGDAYLYNRHVDSLGFRSAKVTR